jgi:hypothetical protein
VVREYFIFGVNKWIPIIHIRIINMLLFGTDWRTLLYKLRHRFIMISFIFLYKSFPSTSFSPRSFFLRDASTLGC